MTWDPAQYLDFGDLRHRAGMDLLARIPTDAAGSVVDLGCGPGTLTLRLAERWPDAAVSGIDSSPEMLQRARDLDPAGRVSWQRGDVATWAPDTPVDVIYANASLHWVDDHDTVLPRLLDALAPRGVLAVQMPRNHDEPSHTMIAATVADGPWRDRLRPLLRPHPVAPPEHYHTLLSPHADHLDVWETVYLQALTGPDPVLEWTMGSVLRPLLAALQPDEEEAFLAQHAARLRSAYPPRDDGVTLFPFRRVFVVAQRVR